MKCTRHHTVVHFDKKYTQSVNSYIHLHPTVAVIPSNIHT